MSYLQLRFGNRLVRLNLIEDKDGDFYVKDPSWKRIEREVYKWGNHGKVNPEVLFNGKCSVKVIMGRDFRWYVFPSN